MMSSRTRSSSNRLSVRWSADYITKIKAGTLVDITPEIPFAELPNDSIDVQLDNDKSCILIVPNDEAASKDFVPEQKKCDEDKARPYRVFRLPLLEPVTGHKCLDIRGVYGSIGITTYDPGFTSTASCHSAITYIDGGNGILLHRGYKIEDLCEHSDIDELSFLLLYGDLPSKDDKAFHVSQIKKHTMVHEKMIQFYRGFHHNAHPMAIMCAVVGGMSAFYHETMDIANPDHRWLSAYRLIAKMPTLAAMAYKVSIGQPFVYPQNKLSFAENFLSMLFSIPAEPYVINPIKAKALDKFLMLHADHEQNASTSTVRIAGSSHANPFACIASGITALWGPAHGGANEAVLNMLHEIGKKENIPKFIAKAKDKKDPFRLMGFGHRVYKNYDPRARVMQAICHELLEELNITDEPLLELAMELERIALSDDYFIKRKLFPNVDFYSGIVLKALGIPVSMYTVLFAVARTIGWISHWKEMIQDPKQRIGRPRQLYIGREQRDYVALSDRHSQLSPELKFTTKV